MTLYDDLNNKKFASIICFITPSIFVCSIDVNCSAIAICGELWMEWLDRFHGLFGVKKD